MHLRLASRMSDQQLSSWVDIFTQRGLRDLCLNKKYVRHQSCSFSKHLIVRRSENLVKRLFLTVLKQFSRHIKKFTESVTESRKQTQPLEPFLASELREKLSLYIIIKFEKYLLIFSLCVCGWDDVFLWAFMRRKSLWKKERRVYTTTSRTEQVSGKVCWQHRGLLFQFRTFTSVQCTYIDSTWSYTIP